MSGRVTHADTVAALNQPTVRPLLLAALDFASGVVRVHTGLGSFVWGGNTYTGVGDFGGISAIRESSALGDDGFELSLSGVNPALIAVSLGEHYQGRSAQVWLAFLDEDHQLIGEPVGPWAGRMDSMPAELGETATIKVNVENRMAAWSRPKIRRYTDADQQSEFPGDKGFEFVTKMVDIDLIWGPTPG